MFVDRLKSVVNQNELIFNLAKFFSKMTSNKSIVWKFFKVKASDSKKVICNLCTNEFSRGGSEEKTCNTSNLHKHLQCRHKDDLEKEIKATEAAAEKTWLKRKRFGMTMTKSSKILKAGSSSSSNSSEDTKSTQLTLEETLSLKEFGTSTVHKQLRFTI